MVSVTRQSSRRDDIFSRVPKYVVVPLIFSFWIFARILLLDVSESFPPFGNVDQDWNNIEASSVTVHTSVSRKPGQLVDQPSLHLGEQGQPCQYDGHCGVGMTCAVNKSSRKTDTPRALGSCQPFTLMEPTSSLESSPCAQKCIEGLPEDAIPLRVSSSQIKSQFRRPNACVLIFRRESEGYTRDDFNPDAYNNALRQHRVVRMDPILDSTHGTHIYAPPPHHNQLLWMAACYEPCDDSQVPYSCPKGFVCIDQVCRRDEKFWKTSDSDMIIVSGADRDYFHALENLAGSLRYWAPENKLVVYNLGMSQNDLEKVDSWDNVLAIKWRDGLPDMYPEHLNIGKAYAWKPVAMKDSLHEYKQIFWLDAGSTVVGPITQAIRATQQHGILLMKGQDLDMKPMSYSATYTAFGYDKATFQGGPHYSGNTQAYLYPSRYIDTVVIPNEQCAVQAECIMPTGSDLSNHRYDQTSLSILAYREDLRIPHYTLYLAAERSQLEPDLRKPSAKFIWTSRGACTDFIKNPNDPY